MLGKVIGIYENRPLTPWKIVIISALKESLYVFGKDLFSSLYTFQNELWCCVDDATGRHSFQQCSYNHLIKEKYHGSKKNPYARR